MEFHTNNHMNTIKNIRLMHDSEYFDDGDDGVFYDELRRQVLQLTEDDDDDDSASAAEYLYEVKKNPYMGFAAQHKEYYNWRINEDREAPARMLKLWRSGNVNGTGVFIPQVVSKPRTRRNRNRKKKNQRDKTNKTVE